MLVELAITTKGENQGQSCKLSVAGPDDGSWNLQNDPILKTFYFLFFTFL